MQPTFSLQFDSQKVAAALCMQPEDVTTLLRSGRVATFVIQSRIAAEQPNWSLVKAPNGGGTKDLRDAGGALWKAKSMTPPITFRPSSQTGQDRKPDKTKFVPFWQTYAGYVLIDAQKFPLVPVYKVPIDNVIKWWRDGEIGEEDAKVSPTRLLQLVRAIP